MAQLIVRQSDWQQKRQQAVSAPLWLLSRTRRKQAANVVGEAHSMQYSSAATTRRNGSERCSSNQSTS
eukprot:6195974-Pleurochrysis_carterae.AAC.2